MQFRPLGHTLEVIVSDNVLGRHYASKQDIDFDEAFLNWVNMDSKEQKNWAANNINYPLIKKEIQFEFKKELA